MKVLRVIQIIDSLNVGGAETLAVNIANGLSEREIFSSLCATRKEGILKSSIDQKVTYFFLDRKKTIDIKAIRKFLKLITKHKISIIHAHSSSLYLAVIIKLLKPRVKLVWHNHYGMNVSNTSIPLKICSFFVSLIINVSEDLNQWAKSRLHAKKTIYLPNFGKFNSKEKDTVLKGEIGKRLLHLGGFRYEKDHITLLKAFKLFVKRNPGWTLHLVGKDYNDAYSKTIHDFIHEHQLSSYVFLYGLQRDVKNIIEQSTIGVLSSISEGLPLSLIEFGMAKVPVVCTDVGQCKEIVQTKELIVPAQNEDALSQAIQSLMNDKEFYDVESDKLYNTVTKRFSQHQFINKLIDLYNSLYLD